MSKTQPTTPVVQAPDPATKPIAILRDSPEQKSLDKAKVKIMTIPNTVFLSTVLFSMKHHWEYNLNPPTAATSGLDLYLHPDFWSTLSPEQHVSLLLHETWHVCWNHMYRGRDHDQKKYQFAADYVINIDLKDRGFAELPGWLCKDDYRGMSTKQVYDALPDDECDDRSDGGQSLMDIMFDDPNATPEELAEKQNDITNAIIKGMTASKLAGDDPGSIPGEIAVQIEELLNPQLPWTILLQDYVTGFVKDDFTYRRPNRRFLPLGFVLPSQHSEKLTEVCISVDTSCSVSDAEFTAFLSEIYDIKERLKPQKMTIISFDTEIKHIHTLDEFDGLDSITFTGRGGTDIRPAMRWAKKNKPVVMITFSDLYFDIDTSDDPEIPCLWIAVNNKNHDHIPFGEVIDMSI